MILKRVRDISLFRIYFKARSDWLLKLRIPFAIYLRAFVTENIVIVAEMNELQSSFCAISSHCFIIY